MAEDCRIKSQRNIETKTAWLNCLWKYKKELKGTKGRQTENKPATQIPLSEICTIEDVVRIEHDFLKEQKTKT